MKKIVQSIFFAFFFVITIFCNKYLQKSYQVQNDSYFFVPASLYCSLKNIAADYFWFKILVAKRLEPKYIWLFTSMITELDPHFAIAYRYGAILLARTNQSVLAAKLLEKSLNSPVARNDKKMDVFYQYFKVRLSVN